MEATDSNPPARLVSIWKIDDAAWRIEALAKACGHMASDAHDRFLVKALSLMAVELTQEIQLELGSLLDEDKKAPAFDRGQKACESTTRERRSREV